VPKGYEAGAARESMIRRRLDLGAPANPDACPHGREKAMIAFRNHPSIASLQFFASVRNAAFR